MQDCHWWEDVTYKEYLACLHVMLVDVRRVYTHTHTHTQTYKHRNTNTKETKKRKRKKHGSIAGYLNV